MRLPRKTAGIARIAAAVILALLIVLCLWLVFLPPNLLRVGSGYAAKIVCSNVFLAGRDPDEVLAIDVQAPGHPLLRLMRVHVDYREKQVEAALLGFIAANRAVYREGAGCSVTPDGEIVHLPLPPAGAEPAPEGPDFWLQGEETKPDQAVEDLLSDDTLAGPGMRAIVVVRNGQIVGEAYGEGFSAVTPLLGWSMTKTVNAAIIGRLIREERISLDETGLLQPWRDDQRKAISLADLLAMEDGLVSDEGYGAVTDVTRMLYLEPDMAGFAADAPLAALPGTRFNYSSATAVLLSRIWMDRLESDEAALAYPRRALFDPLGMQSALMETDARGTFVGSSYMYATARDWARFALFLLRDGTWLGRRLLPEGFVAMMSEPNATSGGRYSKMQTWLAGRDGLPADAFFMQGHDGQTIAIIPSLDLAVVRLGLTPQREGYRATALVAEIVKLGR